MSQELSVQKKMWLTFRRNKPALIGALVTILILLVAILAPWITPYDPLAQDPLIRLEGLNAAHKLGTDDFGRDVLSRIIYGSRISLIIGLASVLFGMVVGPLLGMVAHGPPRSRLPAPRGYRSTAAANANCPRPQAT